MPVIDSPPRAFREDILDVFEHLADKYSSQYTQERHVEGRKECLALYNYFWNIRQAIAVTEEIEVGTVVRLKSGGPWMTTVSTAVGEPGSFVCQWFDGGEALNHEFPAVCLVSKTTQDALPTTFTEYAERAYIAYGNEAGNVNYQGKPMPQWEDLPEQIQENWKAAVIEVISQNNADSNRRA